jgi:iron complex transport system substrate-binding protein
MRRVRAPILALFLASSWLATSAAADPARRVVSLNPSLTSILVALGAGDTLVGVDDFSARQQPAVSSLPRVGGLYDPSLESVVALRPDLVVLVPSAQQRDFRAQLAAAGIEVLAIDPTHFDEVLASIELLGRRVGRSQAAEERVERIRGARSAVERAAQGRPRPRTVLVLQRDPLYVVGGGNFIDEMLRAAGAENLAAGLGDPYPRAGIEWLLASAPELILDASDDPQPAADYWARWASLPAVRSGRVVAVDANLVTLPGAQLGDALRALSRAILASNSAGEGAEGLP